MQSKPTRVGTESIGTVGAMKHIKKLFAVTFVFAGIVSMNGCDSAAFFGGEDCFVNSNYEIECGEFDPGLTQN